MLIPTRLIVESYVVLSVTTVTISPTGSTTFPFGSFTVLFVIVANVTAPVVDIVTEATVAPAVALIMLNLLDDVVGFVSAFANDPAHDTGIVICLVIGTTPIVVVVPTGCVIENDISYGKLVRI